MAEKQTPTQSPSAPLAPKSPQQSSSGRPSPEKEKLASQLRAASISQDSVTYTVDVKSEETTPLLWTPVRFQDETTLCMLGEVCKMLWKIVFPILLLMLLGVPISMIILGISFPDNCPAIPHLGDYHRALGAVFLVRVVCWAWAKWARCGCMNGQPVMERITTTLTVIGGLLDGAWLFLLLLESIGVFSIADVVCVTPEPVDLCPCWIYLYSVCVLSAYWALVLVIFFGYCIATVYPYSYVGSFVNR